MQDFLLRASLQSLRNYFKRINIKTGIDLIKNSHLWLEQQELQHFKPFFFPALKNPDSDYDNNAIDPFARDP